MNKNRLGNSAIVVSELCMGTMTFGSQCDEKMAFAILDRAYDAGIDFFDTAEIYPVPPRPEWAGRTEEIFGRWMKTRSRDALIVASKVAGAAHSWFVPPVREGRTALDRHHIMRAVEGSLRRLQTDYIDLYQIHWPDPDTPYEPILRALDDLVQAGKIRISGCSNETAWGLTKSLWQAEKHQLARFETIQNNFSLNNRRFEDALAEVCRQERISLLPYSPLGGGVLSGKYCGGARPQNARFSRYLAEPQGRQRAMGERFVNAKTLAATERYRQIARDLAISPVTMAAAWSKQHDFVAATIVGASHSDQMDEILAAAGLQLDVETLARIDQVAQDIMYPMG